MHDFSVVIPVRNRSKLLARALVSLGKQKYRNFEVIVVDDGSAEDIRSVVSLFSSELEVRVLDGLGKGATSARNLGTDAALAPFVAYLDSDDVFLPDKLQHVVELSSGDEAEIFVSPLHVWRGMPQVQLRPSRPPFQEEDISEYYFVADQRMQTSSFVILTDLAKRVRWNEQLRKVQDPDFMIRLVRAGGRLRYVSKPLAVLYDINDGPRISSSLFEDNIREWLSLSDGILTEKARKGFMLYVLSYETRKRSLPEAFRLVVDNITAVHPKTTAKAVTRLLLSEDSAKYLASLSTSLSRRRSESSALVNYLTDIELEVHERLASLRG